MFGPKRVPENPSPPRGDPPGERRCTNPKATSRIYEVSREQEGRAWRREEERRRQKAVPRGSNTKKYHPRRRICQNQKTSPENPSPSRGENRFTNSKATSPVYEVSREQEGRARRREEERCHQRPVPRGSNAKKYSWSVLNGRCGDSWELPGRSCSRFRIWTKEYKDCASSSARTLTRS
jgi:hypothetical protein